MRACVRVCVRVRLYILYVYVGREVTITFNKDSVAIRSLVLCIGRRTMMP